VKQLIRAAVILIALFAGALGVHWLSALYCEERGGQYSVRAGCFAPGVLR
jgi:hypothetical protein